MEAPEPSRRREYLSGRDDSRQTNQAQSIATMEENLEAWCNKLLEMKFEVRPLRVRLV